MAWLNPSDSDNTVAERPSHVLSGVINDRWANASQITRYRHTDFNMLLALLRECRDYYGITDTEGDDTILRQAILAGVISRGGLRNRLINGTFTFAQRGASIANPINGQYLLDRWRAGITGTGATRTITQEIHPVGDEPASRDRYFLRWDQSVAAADETAIFLGNKTEGVHTFAGQQVSVSFLAKTNSAFTLGFVTVAQNFGTGGAPSASVITTVASAIAITTNWTLYQYTVTVPSIAGKTLGTNGNDYLELIFHFPINTTLRLDLDDVQLELGPIATEFDRRHNALELEMCKRHFERIGGEVAACHINKGYADSTTHGFFDLNYTEKRATPTVTINNAATAFELQRQGSAVVATTALSATASNLGRKSCQLDATVAAGLTAGESLGLKAKATTGTIDVSAEL